MSHKKRSPKEITSLNQGLFSLATEDLAIEALEQRMELAIAILEALNCEHFLCGTFSSCKSFTCIDFYYIDD